MKCIYCGTQNANSESHIIPEAFGKGPVLKSGVCEKCNHKINEEFEQYIIRKLSFIRNFLQLKGKRNKRPPIDIETSYQGDIFKISIRDPRDFDKGLFAFERMDRSGQVERIAFLSPDKEQLEQAKTSYEKSHPGTKWTEISEEDIKDELILQVYFDFGIFADERMLRLIAKIALEWYCSKRDPEIVIDPDFEDVRKYIRFGEKPSYPIVSVVSNKNILRHFEPIPFGIHALFIGADPINTDLVSIVGIYSLVFFKVILNRRFRALANIEDLATVNPQTGIVYEPVIRGSLAPGPNISGKDKSDFIDPAVALNSMKDELLGRFNKGISRIKSANQI